jgi:hypothetical protein
MTDDRPTTDPLVLAVTGALSEHGFVSNGADHYCGCGGVKFEVWPQWDAYCEHIAEVAVAALVPLIRAQVAEEIRATKAEWMLSAVHAGSDRDRRVAVCTGMECAAALTEGTNRG